MLVRRLDTEIKLIQQSVFPLFPKTKCGFKFRSIDVCIGLEAALRQYSIIEADGFPKPAIRLLA